MDTKEVRGVHNPKDVGKRIKERAKQLGYTAEKLAEAIHVEPATINRIYVGTSMKIDYIYDISEILNVSTDYLLKGETDKQRADREYIMNFFEGLDDSKLDKVYQIAIMALDMVP